MLSFFYGANSFWQGLLLSFICLSFSMGSMVLLRRFWRASDRPRFSDIHGHMFGVIGIIYAILVGAIAVGSWDKFKNAEELAYKEAMTSISIFRSAAGLGVNEEKEIKKLIQNYLTNIVKTEWPNMRQGINPEIKNPDLYALSQYATKVSGINNTQAIFLNAIVQETNKLSEIRGTRLFLAESSLNRIILEFTFFGSFLIILSCIFFGTEHSLLSNMIIISAISLITGLVLTIIMGLDHPYQGDIYVSPKPLESALQFISSEPNN